MVHRSIRSALFALFAVFAASAFAAPGDLDPTFGTAGIARFPVGSQGSTSIATSTRQADGKLVLGGTLQGSPSTTHAIVARLNLDGSLDATFGGSGWVILPGAASVTALATVSQDKILVGVTLANSSDPAMARLNADGSRDAILCCSSPDAFATHYDAYGRKIVALGESADGRMFWATAGTTTWSYEMTRSSVYQFMPQGYPLSGRIDLELGDGVEALTSMRVQPDGALILAGWASPSWDYYAIPTRDAVVARLTPDLVLDTAFGNGGKLVVDFNACGDEFTALAVDPQQRIVALGKAGRAYCYQGESAFALVRFDAATGALDPTFGTGGKRQLEVAWDAYPDNEISVASAVLFAGDDLYVGGATRPSYGGPPFRHVLARLDGNAQATIPSFGGMGFGIVLGAYYQWPFDSILALISGPQGILAAGNRVANTYPTEDAALFGQRYDPASGAADGASLAHKAYIPSGSLSFALAVSTASGRILLGGEHGAFARVYGRDASGAKGNFLGYQGGWVFSGFVDYQVESKRTKPRAAAFQADDSILVGSIVGEPFQTQWAVSRFEPVRGFLDYGWGTQGHAPIAAFQNGDIAAIALQPDGKVVVGGTVQAGFQTFAVARLNANGTLDTTFNGTGMLVLPAGSYDEFATAIALQPDGRIVVAGYTQYPTQMKVVRITTAGALDASWGSGGVALASAVAGASAYSLAIQADGKVVVGGSCTMSACLGRFFPDGTLDGLFGNGGLMSTGGLFPNSFITGVAVLGSGGFTAAGDQESGEPFVMRFLANGYIDSGFQDLGSTEAPVRAGSWSVVVAPSGRATFAGVGDTPGGSTETLMVRFEGDAVDTDPDPLWFEPQVGVVAGSTVWSNPVTITGINDPAPISIVNGYYAIGCTSPWRTEPGFVSYGQTVCLMHFAANTPNTATDTVLTVGNVTATFTSLTGGPPETTITSAPPATSGPNVSFSFLSDATQGPVTFYCALDAASFSVCTDPATFTGLGNGSHTFQVYSQAFHGTDATPATYTWTVDAIAPEVVIDSQPAYLTTDRNAAIAFHANDASAVTFECSLDGAAYVACTSPVSYSNLASGSHDVDVRATDAAGNLGSYRTRWTIDGEAPDTTVVNGPTVTNAASSTFNFSATEQGTFECSSNGGASWLPCANPLVTDNTLLADGTYTIHVRAKDEVGNIDPTPATWTYTLDRAAPETSFNYAPTGTTSNTTATASFFSNEPGATFECRLDGAAFAACTSPVSYPGLAEGTHGIEVRARDAAGNTDASPSASTWTVDLTAPETTIVSGPSGTVAQASGTFTFSSPDAGATFQCSVDGGGWFGCGASYPFYNFADGTHLLEVRAVDGAGNFDASPASRTWTIDTTAPNTTISSGPEAVTSETGGQFVFASPDGASFMCSLDGAPATACSSPKVYTGLAGGAHTFAVHAIDAAGNPDPSPATWSWAIDASAPETTIVSGPTGTVTQTSATLSFTSDDPAATFECRLDGAAFAACTSPVTLSGLSSANHAFEVRAKDAVGNYDPTPAARTWTVDTVAPDTSITAGPAAAVNVTTASFSFTATEAATFECKIDAGAFAACSSPKAYSGLAVGSHTFQVRARDAAGNQDATPATHAWTVDTTAPNTTITSGPSGSNNPNTATFAFTSTEGGTFECKLDTGAFAACTTPKTYTGLAKGSHTFQVRAIDAAGNVDATPASRTWSVK